MNKLITNKNDRIANCWFLGCSVDDGALRCSTFGQPDWIASSETVTCSVSPEKQRNSALNRFSNNVDEVNNRAEQ
nr:unnamed protein product [Callosobruchus chinensis]